MHTIYDKNSRTYWNMFFYNEEELYYTVIDIVERLRWKFGPDYVPDLFL